MKTLNRDKKVAWKYHNSTKHSWESVRTSPHFLDWSNQPRLFKIYPGPKPIPLPKDFDHTGRPALWVIGSAGTAPLRDGLAGLRDLAAILYFSAGITRRRAYSGGEILFRAAACTGALSSIDLYVVCQSLEDLDAGVYHFDPVDFALRQLRAGDYRSLLVQATASEPAIKDAPVTIICSGTYWRNAWKYQARTYRHFGWDNGTLLSNLLATATARNLPGKIVQGFLDESVNALLGLDVDKEVALNLVPIGRGSSPLVDTDLAPLKLETIPYSRHEVDYPVMRDMHAGSSLLTLEEVAGWRAGELERPLAPVSGVITPLDAISAADMPQDSIEQVISRRGSTRRFSRTAISFREFSTALYQSTRGVPADFLAPAGSQLNDVYIICHAIEGLAPGSYVLHRDPWGLELLQKGDFRQQAGHLDLDQDLAADCSAAVFFLADLNPILERFGNRGYRATQLEAGIIGGRLYLAMYAQRLGATGLTFYDDDVTRFFSPHAEGKSAIFLVALGKSEPTR